MSWGPLINRELYETGKAVAQLAFEYFESREQLEQTAIFDDNEIKLPIDSEINDLVLPVLRHTGLSILSEESPWIYSEEWPDGAVWVLDPMDGSYNYYRGLGPFNFSLALWEGRTPMLGFVLDYSTGNLNSAGTNPGEFELFRPVSAISSAESCQKRKRNESVVYTGFPSRSRESSLHPLTTEFSKVRMVGCASESILTVARGLADCYCENGIMFWDVAGALAVARSAGSQIQFKIHADLGWPALDVVVSAPNLTD